MNGFDEVFDFIVVGSGGGSMCAALVLRNAGKSVLILEKTDLVGGSTAKSGGVMWIPANRFMRDAGIYDSFEKADAYLDATAGTSADAPGATPERRRTYVRQATAMIDFLVSQGIKLRRSMHWPDYYDDRPGGSAPGRTVVAELFDLNQLGAWKDRLRPNAIPIAASLDDLFKIVVYKRSWAGKRKLLQAGLRLVSGKLTGKRWATAGAALQGRMLEAALRKNVDIRINAAVDQLIVEAGAVRGVVATIGGAQRRIGARLGVLLNAGGFAQNRAMREQHIAQPRTEWSHAAPGDTGDMHRELVRIGAAMGQMDEMIGNQSSLPPGAELAAVQPHITKPHAFLVDQSGVRYMNECGSYMEFCKRMIARDAETGAIPSWMILDSRYLKSYSLASSSPGSRKPKAWFDQNYLRTGKTIGDLAQACDIDPAALEATTERFNSFVRAGKDEDFHRGERAYDRFLGDFTHGPVTTLGTVEESPFYAIPIIPGDVGTFGGAVTDCDARVLRPDGSVIDGLYATGTTTASVMGRVYPGAGSSIGPSFTWGYVAANHASRRAAQGAHEDSHA